MKITETIDRECCQQKDLKPVIDSKLVGRQREFLFCVHCGARHRYTSYMDAAGSTDWEYRKEPISC
jgi:hypothetical protein